MMPATTAPPAATLVVESPVRVGTPAEQGLITQFEREQQVPSWLREGWAKWQSDREYLHTVAFAMAETRALGVNLSARAIQMKLTRIEPSEADLVVRQERQVGSVDWARKDAIRQLDEWFRGQGIPAQPQALIAAADEAERQYKLAEERRERFAVTGEVLTAKQLRGLGFTYHLSRSALNAFTVGMAWAKVGWQADYSKDSAGRRRWDDAQDQLALLQVRLAEFRAGWFTENDPKYQELIDLSDYARQAARGAMDGEAIDTRILDVSSVAGSQDGRPLDSGWVAEPAAWHAPTVDRVAPENLRWDWRVSPLQHEEGDYVAEQILMDRDEAAARFKLSPQEAMMLGTGSAGVMAGAATPDTLRQINTPGQEPPEPGSSHYEAATQNGKVVVWDRYDFKRGRRYMWCAGLSFFTLNEPLPVFDDSRSPYACLAFNEFDGKQLPISEVHFLRKLQDAINQRLTDGQESLWASMKRYIVKKDAFKTDELSKLRGAVPHDVIECEDPQDIRNSWMEIASDDWNGEKYSLDQLFQLFELVMGMSLSQLGLVNVANTATEANIAENNSAASADRHATALAAFASKLATKVLHYNAAFMPEEQAKKQTGPQAVWPMPRSREELIHGMRLEITAAGNQRQAKQQEVASINAALDALRKVAAVKLELAAAGLDLDAMVLATPLLRLADVRGPAREALRPMAPPTPSMPGMQPGQPAQSVPGAPAVPGVPEPNANPLRPQSSQTQPGDPPG